MKKVTATELKKRTGECLDKVQKEPLEIEKNGRSIAVLIAREDYDRLAKLENDYWLARVEAAEEEGYIGIDKSMTELLEHKEKIIKSAKTKSH